MGQFVSYDCKVDLRESEKDDCEKAAREAIRAHFGQESHLRSFRRDGSYLVASFKFTETRINVYCNLSGKVLGVWGEFVQSLVRSRDLPRLGVKIPIDWSLGEKYPLPPDLSTWISAMSTMEGMASLASSWLNGEPQRRAAYGDWVLVVLTVWANAGQPVTAEIVDDLRAKLARRADWHNLGAQVSVEVSADAEVYGTALDIWEAKGMLAGGSTEKQPNRLGAADPFRLTSEQGEGLRRVRVTAAWSSVDLDLPMGATRWKTEVDIGWTPGSESEADLGAFAKRLSRASSQELGWHQLISGQYGSAWYLDGPTLSAIGELATAASLLAGRSTTRWNSIRQVFNRLMGSAPMTGCQDHERERQSAWVLVGCLKAAFDWEVMHQAHPRR